MTSSPVGPDHPPRLFLFVTTLAVIVSVVWSGFEILDARGSLPVSAGIEPPPGVPLYTTVLSLTDAASDGRTWYLLDGQAMAVHRIVADSGVVGSFGRRGPGPGEFLDPQALTVHGDTVVVAERDGGLSLFDLSGRHLLDRNPASGGCIAPGTAQLASTRGGLVLLTVCMVDGMALEARLLLLSPSGSVQSLAISRTNRSTDGLLDPYFVPVIAAADRDVAFGLVGDTCITRFGLQGDTLGSICHDWLERLPLPANELRDLERLQERAAAAGGRLAMPTRLPPFERIFRDPDGTMHYRVPARGVSGASTLRWEEPDGTRGSLDLPGAAHLFVHDGIALLAWSDLEGTRIGFRPVGTRPPHD